MRLDEISRALQADAEEIERLLQDPSDALLRVLLNNENLTELALSAAIRRSRLSPKTLAWIAEHPRWRDAYRVLVALAHNRNTPHRVTLKFLKRLRLFDLVSLLHAPHVAPDIRVAAERLVLDRLKEDLPWGTKIAVARRATANILDRIIDDPALTPFCLDNRRLRETSLCRAIHLHLEDPALLDRIATHFIWSSRYAVRLALARNPFLPERRRFEILQTLRRKDLRQIAKDETLPRLVRQQAATVLAASSREMETAPPAEAKILLLDPEDPEEPQEG
ncbi:MAG: hypothetical protein D6795_03465 [Deltaproteobacteria bacterium]|nr:MAG: hypothetical protein D6795_03465 [Deltaproteobacteria bacterium]